MATTLKVKFGGIEIEYEGEAAVGIEEIKDLLVKISGLAPAVAAIKPAPAIKSPDDAANSQDGGASGDLSQLGVNSVAARLEAKTGSELAIAAAAQLQICAGKASFTRKELLDAMQSAKSYYKGTMGSNLTKSIASLTASKRLNALSNSEMSLSAAELSALKAKLAD